MQGINVFRKTTSGVKLKGHFRWRYRLQALAQAPAEARQSGEEDHALGTTWPSGNCVSCSYQWGGGRGGGEFVREQPVNRHLFEHWPAKQCFHSLTAPLDLSRTAPLTTYGQLPLTTHQRTLVTSDNEVTTDACDQR